VNKLVDTIVITVFASIAVFAAASVPFIPEICIVCGEHQCPTNEQDTLRNMSVIDWSLDAIDDVHFGCVKNWEDRVYDPRK